MNQRIGYARVSTVEQSLDLQLDALRRAGVDSGFIYEDKASGKSSDRPALASCLKALRSGDTLVVWKLDRLGRDAIDVSTTVKALAEMGVRVYCLALGGADLTGSAGTMTMNVLNAVAQFERDLLIERTQSGLKRAKSEGKTLGRPFTLSDEQKQGVRNDLAKGMSVSAIARKFATSRQTIMRVRDEGSRSVRP